ncbi:MAG: hypothetical protein ACOWWM_01070 [Desulfobacterales bacterium]
MTPKSANRYSDAHQVKKALLSYLDGMGEFTAKVIINEQVSPELKDKFNLRDMKNLGRYYHVKLVGLEGEAIDDLLVDKQNGNIISSKGSEYSRR